MKRILVDGMFYIGKRMTIDIENKPEGVRRYLIYESIDPVKLARTSSGHYSLKPGQIIEVCTNDLKRHFYKVDRKRHFEKLEFSKEYEQEEGEDVLKKHLGLQGIRYVNPILEKLENNLQEHQN